MSQTDTSFAQPLSRPPARPVLGALAVVCHRVEGEECVILVKRRNPPNAGCWGFPGGHVELGETAAQAAARELQEETGVVSEPGAHLLSLDVIPPASADPRDARQYHLVATLCHYVSGTPQPDDDALEARWVPVDRIDAIGLDLLDQVAELSRLAQHTMAQARSCGAGLSAPPAPIR